VGGPVGGLLGGVLGSAVGYIRTDEYDGAIRAVSGLDEGRRDELMLAVGTVLVGAGATISNLSTLEGYRESLIRSAEEEGVRNRIWKACVDAMRT